AAATPMRSTGARTRAYWRFSRARPDASYRFARRANPCGAVPSLTGSSGSSPPPTPSHIHTRRRCIAMLMQFDPFREFDRLAEQLAAGARTPRPFPMDAYRRGDEFVVCFDLPGMDPGTIDLTVEQNVLTIKAERRFERREGDEVI